MVNRPISAQEIAASVTERLGLPAEVRKGGGVRVSNKEKDAIAEIKLALEM